MTRSSFLLLLIPGLALAVPQPVRDTAYDWRCLNPDGTATNHQRQDTAIYACQTRAEQSPGETFYIEGGRYRVLVEAAETPAPEPEPEPEPPTDPAPDSGALYDLDATDSANRGPIPFSVDWPSAPVTIETVSASCGNVAQLVRTVGRHVVLSEACSVSVSFADHVWLDLAEGASVGAVTIPDGVGPVRISAQVPRTAQIGAVTAGSDSHDIVLDGVRAVGGGAMNLYDFQRLALLNSYVSYTGGYQVAAWRGQGAEPPRDLIIANVQVEARSNGSYRLQHVDGITIVDSLGDTRQTGYASLRIEFNAENVWVRNYTGFGGGMTLDPQVGSSRPSATVHDVTIYDSDVYHTDFISITDTQSDLSDPAKVYGITIDGLIFHSGSQWNSPGARISGVQGSWDVGRAEYAGFDGRYPEWQFR